MYGISHEHFSHHFSILALPISSSLLLQMLAAMVLLAENRMSGHVMNTVISGKWVWMIH